MAGLAPFRRRGGGPLFPRPSDGGHYTPNGLSSRIRRFLHSYGVCRSAHALRHRFATRYTEVDPDIRNLQALLGHADPGTTMIYTTIEPRGAALGVAALTEDTRRRRAGGR